VFYPDGGVSRVQRLQMVTQEGGNVCVYGARGNFDDVQTMVKTIFTDNGYRTTLDAKGYGLSSANSINWGRLVPQIVYYVNSYCQMAKNGTIQSGDKINIVVPTGNFGNILAAYYAKSAGLPVNKLICASNKNNILTDFINTGVYDKNRDFSLTISPSMDILISSNLERLLFDFSDDATVTDMMKRLTNEGRYQITADMRERLGQCFRGGYCDDAATMASIKEVFDEYGYLIDTHTAVGYNVYRQYAEQTGDGTKTLIASTASPYKFGGSVYKALTGKLLDDEFAMIDGLFKLTKAPVPAPLSDLVNKAVRFDGVTDTGKMYDAVNGFLGINTAK